jgi:PPK2 family polyphosphate:nucleotide phosphotransferase
MDQFGIQPLCPAPRGRIEFVREDARGNRDGDAFGVEIPEFVLPIETGARKRRVRQSGLRHSKPTAKIEARMKIKCNDFRVPPGKDVNLRKWPTDVRLLYKSKHDYKRQLQEHVEQLSELQRLHYAYNRYSLLLIFQGMDAAGKDSAIAHVMAGVNPQGCRVYSFKQPSHEELRHDFLWRTTRVLPERGQIGIFNRSYYEEVLIVRIHPELLANEGLPPSVLDARTVWRHRYRSIVDHENHLHRNGTLIVKFFLHISPKEQRKRFLERIDEPEKNWKFSIADVEERAFWNQYMKAYEKCLSATSTHNAPWYAVPADDKRNAQLIVSQIIVDTLAGLRMTYPKPDSERRMELQQIRARLAKEDPGTQA